jgi:ABC-type branched-subunit amino acid transport system ATPase component
MPEPNTSDRNSHGSRVHEISDRKIAARFFGRLPTTGFCAVGQSRTPTAMVAANWRGQSALLESSRVGLDHLAERPLAQTAYGERRRVEIAMALAQNPKVLLLDEPFAGLSSDERRDVQLLLAAIPREVTIVMIEHDMDVALDFAERITVLHFGKVEVEGTRGEVVAHPRTREIYLGE